jgi:hypothetical protein
MFVRRLMISLAFLACMGCVLPAMAQSGGGESAYFGDPPKSYWGFIATPIANKRDRVLTENLDGPRKVAMAIIGSTPKKDAAMQVICAPTPIRSDTCFVKLYALELSPNGSLNISGRKFNIVGVIDIMNNTGATGYWNGKDSSKTTLPDGSSAGGYALVDTVAKISAAKIRINATIWYVFRFDYTYEDYDYSGTPDTNGYVPLRRVTRVGVKYSIPNYHNK